MKPYFFLFLTWLSLAGGGAMAQRSPQRAARLSRSAQPTLQARAGNGPNLDRVEYFLDADPGVGAATSVPLGAASSAWVCAAATSTASGATRLTGSFSTKTRSWPATSTK